MSFEIVHRDLAGRIGKLETPRGVIDTPLFLPVINPALQPISLEEIRKDFDCQAIIANAYLLKKHHEKEVLEKGIHDFLKFDGVIATDSGGYQILLYGDVEVSPEEIVRFQEEIGTDIAVILDIPTGWNAKRERAEYTVDETLKRARVALSRLTRKDLLWVGPVQGGNHLDLVSRSATEMGEMPFDIFALGSPTQVIEQYLFDVMADMIVAAKTKLPVHKPFHLFGAGHPFMLSFAVALGCDIFDSAAYALYARRGKYMTNYGTVDLKNLQFVSCSCNVCTKYTPRELLGVSAKERERLLAWHNLDACFREIERIKQALCDGRLWELLELRSRSHPALLQALKRLRKYPKYLEVGTPISKRRGLFYFSSTGLARPELVRYRERIRRWVPPTQADVLVMLSRPSTKPFHRSKELGRVCRCLSKKLGKDMRDIDLCVYAEPYGVIPLVLDETYPLSQFEVASPLDRETIDYVIAQIEEYLDTRDWYRAVVVQPNPIFGEKVKNVCKRVNKLERLVVSPFEEDLWSEKAINNFVDIVYATYTRSHELQGNPA